MARSDRTRQNTSLGVSYKFLAGEPGKEVFRAVKERFPFMNESVSYLVEGPDGVFLVPDRVPYGLLVGAINTVLENGDVPEYRGARIAHVGRFMLAQLLGLSPAIPDLTEVKIPTGFDKEEATPKVLYVSGSLWTDPSWCSSWESADILAQIRAAKLDLPMHPLLDRSLLITGYGLQHEPKDPRFRNSKHRFLVLEGHTTATYAEALSRCHGDRYHQYFPDRDISFLINGVPSAISEKGVTHAGEGDLWEIPIEATDIELASPYSSYDILSRSGEKLALTHPFLIFRQERGLTLVANRITADYDRAAGVILLEMGRWKDIKGEDLEARLASIKPRIAMARSA